MEVNNDTIINMSNSLGKIEERTECIPKMKEQIDNMSKPIIILQNDCPKLNPEKNCEINKTNLWSSLPIKIKVIIILGSSVVMGIVGYISNEIGALEWLL